MYYFNFVMILYALMFLKLASLLVFIFRCSNIRRQRVVNPVTCGSGLLADLVAYRDRVRKSLGGSHWLFLTRTGNFISPSVSKIIALIQSRTCGIISN